MDSNEAGEQSKELIGNIWHNLGTAYARLFLFQEAMNCYEKAYALNGNPESKIENQVARQCLMHEIDVKNSDFTEKLDGIATLNTREHRSQYNKAVSDVIFNWKEEYRRICRI